MAPMRELLGTKISALRRKMGYTQEQLCEYADLSQNFLSQIENGKKNISIDTLCKICEALNTDPRSLLTGCKTAGSGKKITEDAKLKAQITHLSKLEKKMLLNLLKTYRKLKKNGRIS